MRRRFSRGAGSVLALPHRAHGRRLARDDARARKGDARRTPEAIAAERARWTTRSEGATQHISSLRRAHRQTTQKDDAALAELIPAFDDRRRGASQHAG